MHSICWVMQTCDVVNAALAGCRKRKFSTIESQVVALISVDFGRESTRLCIIFLYGNMNDVRMVHLRPKHLASSMKSRL